MWTFFDKSKFLIWTKNPWIVAIASLFPLAVLFSLFSLGGTDSALLALKSWYWPLVACPVAIIAADRKSITPLVVGLLIGLLIASLYSYSGALKVISMSNSVAFMSDDFRITSFWDVSRWGFFSGAAVLFLLQLLAVSNRREKLIYGSILLITLISFLMTSTRAPLLAFILLSLLLTLSDRKMRKYAFFLICFLIIFAGTIPKYQARILSIFQIQLTDEKLVSKNQSNLDRLNMWKVAIDFYKEQPLFGTGFENSEAPLRNFLQHKDPAYIVSYVSQGFSYRDQHSSYFTALVQFGLIFTVITFLLIGVIFMKTIVFFWKTRDFLSRFSLIGLSYCFIVFIFYSSLASYEASVFFMALSLGALRFSDEMLPIAKQIA